MVGRTGQHWPNVLLLLRDSIRAGMSNDTDNNGVVKLTYNSKKSTISKLISLSHKYDIAQASSREGFHEVEGLVNAETNASDMYHGHVLLL